MNNISGVRRRLLIDDYRWLVRWIAYRLWMTVSRRVLVIRIIIRRGRAVLLVRRVNCFRFVDCRLVWRINCDAAWRNLRMTSC